MKTDRLCNQCSKPLPESAADGACPSCLLEWGLGGPGDDAPTVVEGGANPVAPNSSAGTPSTRLTYFGNYELLEEIARGGMGIVYKARQANLNRLVAVKVILAGQFASADATRRFKSEAEAAAHLRHPHIVGIHEVGEHEGFHYFSMDYIAGKDLGAVAREQLVSPRHAAEWVKTIAEAIHYAHEQGILHRDLKPSNILIDADKEPHVTDFGLAKQMESNSDITHSGQVLGSPNYMPPEQAEARHKDIGRPGDVYSLGAILFHLLTGRPPFVAPTVVETLHQVSHRDVTAPRLLNPSTPEDLETICLKCLEKEPRRRFQTAQELADELGRHLRDEPIRSRPISRRAKAWRWCRRKPVIASLAASLVGVFCLGFGGVVWQLRRVEAKSEESRQQVARLNVLSGVNLMQAGDYLKSLLWFAEALRVDQGNPAREEIHRMRIASVLEQCPRLVQVISHDGLPLVSAAFSPTDDRLATISVDNTARVWEMPGGKLLLKSKPLPAVPYALAFSPDGNRLLVTLLNGTVQFVDTRTGELILKPLPHQIEAGGNQPLRPTLDPTGKFLVTQPVTNSLQIFDTENGGAIGPRLVHTNAIERIQFSADGARLFTRTQMPASFAWDTRSGAQVPFPVIGPDAFGNFFFSERGDVALINGRIWKWKASATTNVGERLMDDGSVMWAAFSPANDRVLIASRDRTARIWDTATGRPLTPPLPHDQMVTRGAFSPDGYRVVTVSQDNVARVWDADFGQPLTPPIPHADGAGAAVFSGSGRYFFTMHPEHLLYVWDLHSDAHAPVLLKPLQNNANNDVAPHGGAFVAREMNMIRVRSVLSGSDVTLHPASVKTAPKQAWFDATGRFVILEGELARVQIWDGAPGGSGLPITPPVQSRYTLDEDIYKTVKLPSDRRPVQELIRLAELLSGNRLDGTGAWTNLNSEEIQSAWQDLGGQDPKLAPSAKVDLAAWHRREAEAAAGTLDWAAAAFHWSKLKSLVPDNREFAERAEYAALCFEKAEVAAKNYEEKRRLIPPRDSRTDARLIDLSAHFARTLDEDLFSARRDFGGRAGVQTLGGVPFDVRGMVELFGLEAAVRGWVHPEKVVGIQVQQRCARIHFLHEASWAGSLAEGEEMVAYIVHYANGQTERIPIQNQIHLVDDWFSPPAKPKQAEVVRLDTSPGMNASSATLRLVKYTWSNPHPDWEIALLDLVSAKTKANYNLLALTVE